MDTSVPVTDRQRAVYEFVREKIRGRGYGPTVREIGEHFGIHSPNGVMCHLKALERNDMIQVSIQDTGIGMTEEQIKKVFDEFYKADISTHELHSSGLGLSICKRIVEKHGGKIWVESPGPGKGSIFYFTLKKGKMEHMVVTLKDVGGTKNNEENHTDR